VKLNQKFMKWKADGAAAWEAKANSFEDLVKKLDDGVK